MSRHLTLVDFADEDPIKALEAAARASHPAGSKLSTVDLALLELEKWSMRLDVAREAYGLALVDCHELGIPNVKIARRLGKTEAAIRMYLARRRSRSE